MRFLYFITDADILMWWTGNPIGKGNIQTNKQKNPKKSQTNKQKHPEINVARKNWNREVLWTFSTDISTKTHNSHMKIEM